jgi:hypothetical protein
MSDVSDLRKTLERPRKERRRSDPTVEVVFFATHDRTGVERVARALAGQAVVRQVADSNALLAALSNTRARRPHLVIDCCVPTLDPMRFAQRLPELPEGSQVLLWGATAELAHRIEDEVPAAKHWIPTDAGATHEDVAMLLSNLL